MSHKVSVVAGLRKFFVFSTVLLVIVIVLILYDVNTVPPEYRQYARQRNGIIATETQAKHSGFYVSSRRCRMPHGPPFTEKIRKIYKWPPQDDCTGSAPIVTSSYDESLRRYQLHYDEQRVKKLHNSTLNVVRCCYRRIVRSRNKNSFDDSHTSVTCVPFGNDFLVPQHIDYGIIVNCFMESSVKGSAAQRHLLQEDAFMFVHHKTQLVAAGKMGGRKKPSVLLLGIDSMSRINLPRVMPKTYAHLRDMEWYEMEGYNKIADNTFPNLMAILTGFNATTVKAHCDPSQGSGLNACRFVWDDFHDAGYYTAYGEDLHQLATFNYKKKGFHAQPVDYYLRPFTIAVETKLRPRYRNGLSYCQGRRQTATYVYDFAVEFARRHCRHNSTGFGLFWVNSFSHNDFAGASSMDTKIRHYLQTLAADGILDESVVVFLSDHGSRWGPLMMLPESYLHERLPMLFVWLPPWFRQQYPVEMQALHENRNRLSSPYDLHATLKHLLGLGRGQQLPAPHDCRQCRSLLTALPVDRGCSEAGIPDHWCTCIPYDPLDVGEPLMLKIAHLIVTHMNDYIKGKGISALCAEIRLKRILYAERRSDSQSANAKDGKFYRLKFQTNPKSAIFQATVRYWENEQRIELNVESISRLNMYLNDAYCMKSSVEKKYCFCRK